MVQETRIYIKHLFFSSIFLVFEFFVLYFYSDSIKNIFYDPYKYFDTNLTVEEIQFFIIVFFIITLAVLLSYIFYLLLTSHSRYLMQVKNTTKSIEFSKEQFKKIYDNAPVPYIMLGENAEIHEPNKSALRFFGVTEKEIEGLNFFSYIMKGTQDTEIYFQYYKNGININRKEIDIIVKNGETKSILLSTFKIKNFGTFSKDSGLVMIFDITEQKLLDKKKTEFLSLASHQLRTPLATTKWYTEMLNSEELGEMNEKQKEYVKKLYAVNKDMIDLVEVLLNVSRIEMGTLPIELAPTNIEELVENILVELSPLIEKKKIKINKQYNNLFKNVNTDNKLLRIVLQNLISNSVKYTPDEGIVSVTFENSTTKKIIVSDTGIGIPEEEQGRIFSKLFRANNARTLSTSQGTGLGLYLVKSIIESMGGSINFISKENQGSVFTLILNN